MTTVELPGGATARFTGRDEGDLGHASPAQRGRSGHASPAQRGRSGHSGEYVYEVAADVATRRRAVLDLPWTWLRQVHGDEVVQVVVPGGGAGTPADAAVTAEEGCALAVLTADCAPVVFASAEGVVGAAHAGWSGLTAGVLERTVDAMADLGATDISAVLGPCIRAECYEFGTGELDRIAERLGPEVRARDTSGAPALDLAAGVRSALRRAGVDRVDDLGSCTACSTGWYSWRARKERQRQAAVIWR